MARIDVVTVWAPRPALPQYRDYTKLLLLQRDTAEAFGHRHVVVTDCPHLIGLQTMQVSLPDNLMQAQIAGQLAYLEAWSGEHALLLADADCLVARRLDDAFDGSFDIGLTNRADPVAPVNNGAMYIAAGAKSPALDFFRRALADCGTHWGADQEAISRAAAPVPQGHGIERRGFWRIGFLSMLTHNVVPKQEGRRHFNRPYVVHFKGANRKEWAGTYARRFIFPDAAALAAEQAALPPGPQDAPAR